jgi:hypothetical protein
MRKFRFWVVAGICEIGEGMHHIHVHLEFISGMLFDPVQSETERWNELPGVCDAMIRRVFEERREVSKMKLVWALEMSEFGK